MYNRKKAETVVVLPNGEEVMWHDTKGIPRTVDEMKMAVATGYVIPAFKTGHSVEKLLDYVDLALDWYVPSEEAFNVINFIRASLGKEPENLNSKAHYFFIDAMLHSEEIRPYFEVRGMDFDKMARKSLILSSREFSKALTLDTEIMLKNGNYKRMGDIKVGDEVVDRNGEPTKVTGKSKVYRHTSYRITLSDGRTIETSKNHDNIIIDKYTKAEIVIESKDLFKSFKNGGKYSIPASKNVRPDIMKKLMNIDRLKVNDEDLEQIREYCFLVGGSLRILSYCRGTYSVDFQIGKAIDVVDVNKMATTPTQCIEVASKTHSYVLKNGLITHNSVLATFFLLYLAYKGEKKNLGKVKLALYISDKMEGNVMNTMRTIKSIVLKSEFLSNYFEDTHFTDKSLKLVRPPRTKREIAAYAKAMKQGKRPDEVMYRGDRTFTLKGIGSSGGRGPLTLDSVVYCDNGTKTIGNVEVGDKIFTPEGKLTTVTKKSKLYNDKVYKLTYADGREIRVNETHINVAYTRVPGEDKYIKHNVVTNDLVSVFNSGEKIYTKLTSPVEYTYKELPLDPYLLGLALGDGHMEYGKGLRIKGIDFHVDHYISKLNGYDFIESVSLERSGTRMKKISFHGLVPLLKEMGLSGVTGSDKFIPEIYLRGNIEQRKSLLAGLLDTDGSCTLDKRWKGSSVTSFSNISKNLAYGVVDLSRSLGYRARVTFKDRGGNRRRLYNVTIRSFENPFTLKYKADNWRLPSKNLFFDKLKTIEFVGNMPTQCITVNDEKHEFLTTGYLPTHNSRDEDLGRPDLAVFDDLIGNENDAYSKAYLENIESTIEADIGMSMSGMGSETIFIGTAYHTNDPIYKRVTSGNILPVVFPRAEVQPHGSIYNIDGDIVEPELKEEDFISVWPDRHTWTQQKEMYSEAEDVFRRTGNPKPLAKIDQELYVRVTSQAERLITEQMINFQNMSRMRDKSFKKLCRITTDFTTTSNVGSNKSAASLWVITSEPVFNLYDFSVRKKDIEEQYDDVIALARKAISELKVDFVEIAIEIDGQQATHVYSFKKRCDEVGFFDYVLAKQFDAQNIYSEKSIEGIRSNGVSKMERLRFFVSKYFNTANVYFNEALLYNPDYDNAMEEIALCTKEEAKAGDDFLDTLSQNYLCSDMNIPSGSTTEYLDVEDVKTNVNYGIMTKETNDFLNLTNPEYAEQEDRLGGYHEYR